MERIPGDVLAMILSRLDGESFVRAAAVDRHWRRTALRPAVLWGQLVTLFCCRAAAEEYFGSDVDVKSLWAVVLRRGRPGLPRGLCSGDAGGGPHRWPRFKSLSMASFQFRNLDFAVPSVVQQVALVPITVLKRNAVVIYPAGTGKTLNAIMTLPRFSHGCSLLLTCFRPSAHFVTQTLIENRQLFHAEEIVNLFSNSLPQLLQDPKLKVVVGSPESALKFLHLFLPRLTHVILDDADDMFVKGMGATVESLCQRLGNHILMSVYSCSENPSLMQFVKLQNRAFLHIRPPPAIELDPKSQYHVDLGRDEWKEDALLELLEMIEIPVVVFCVSVKSLEVLAEFLEGRKVSAFSSRAAESSWVEQGAGSHRVFLTTDMLAAAGEFRSKLRHACIHFDLPRYSASRMYMDRCVFACISIVLLTEANRLEFRHMEQFYGITISELPLDFLEHVRINHPE